MRLKCLVALAAFLISPRVFAQYGNVVMQPTSSAPTGGCSFQQMWNDLTHNNLYACIGGTPVKISGSAGTGTVTSVGLAGTANQITVTGASPITSSGSWTLSFPAGGVTLPVTTLGSGGTVPSGQTLTIASGGTLTCAAGSTCPASSLPNLPTTPNSIPQTLTTTPSGGVGQNAVWSLPGLVNRAVTGTTTSDTILATDQQVVFQQSTTVAETLPTATTLAIPNFVVRLSVASGAGTVTVTPTTWTINGASTLTIVATQSCLISVDAAGSAWDANCNNLPTTSGVVGGIIATIPAATSTTVSGWGGGSGSAPGAFGSDLTLDRWTANLEAANGVGGVWTIGPELYSGVTASVLPFLFSIPNNAAAGIYQQTTSTQIYIPAGQQTAVNAAAVSPTNGTVGAIGFITAEVVGAKTQPLIQSLGGSSVAGSTTVYTGFSNAANLTTTSAPTSYVVAPYAFTASSLCINTKGAQPSGGTLAVTLIDLPSPYSTPSSTSLTVAVPASGGIGMYCDTTHTASIAAGDIFYTSLVNGSGSTSATVYTVTMMTTIPSPYTGMVAFGLNGETMANNSTLYFQPFKTSTGSSTEPSQEAGAPRAFTASILSCWVTTAPLTSTNAITIRQNAANPVSGLTVTLALATTGLIQDNSHTIAYANKDSFDLMDVQASGTAPAVSSCSMAID